VSGSGGWPIGWNRVVPGGFSQRRPGMSRDAKLHLEDAMADYLEAANLLRIMIHKMRGTVSEGNGDTHLEIDVTKSEMQRLIQWGTADEVGPQGEIG
jgi:hypothetical protein